jgi:hypothetical protein
MEISKTPKITPEGPPAPPAAEEYVWMKLVPRLLNPGTLSIITLLLREGKAHRLRELAGSIELSCEHTR